jgi:hypothetical protein
MLGLSLAIRVGKRVLGSLIDSLMSAVKGRATYSENIADSKQVVKDIDNYELLDKASILLTPTAYSDARVHSVKTYTGDELVVNGGFDADSDWSKSEGWTIVNGKATHDGLSSYKKISQLITTVVGNTYRYEATVSNLTTSQVYLMARINNEFGTIIFNNLKYDNGNYVFYFKALSTTTAIVFQNGNSNEVSIDNSSVVDVSSDFDFDRASSATRINSDGLVQDMQSITDPELVLNGDFEELGDELVTNGTFDTDSDWTLGAGWSIEDGKAVRVASSSTDLVQVSVFPNLTSIFKITFDVVRSAGSVRLRAGTFNLPYVGATDTYTYYVTPTSNDQLKFQADSSFEGSIDNVSVQQVDPNDRWTLGTGWSVEDGVASYGGGSNSAIIQNISLTSGNVYNIKFTVSNASGNASIFIGNGSGNVDYFGSSYTDYANGDYDLYFTMPSTQSTLAFYGESTGSNFSIDNISVKDITFSEDVDLARINYDSNGENGHWLLEPTSTNLIPYSEDFEGGSWTNGSVGTTPTLDGGYTAPDGSNSAYKISNPNKDSFWRYFGVTDTNYARTIWARTVSGIGTISLLSKHDNTNNTFTLTEDWQRFEVNTTDISATFFYAVDFRGVGNTLDEVLVWGAQSEDLSYATSYIPTYGSTVTRATETLTGSGNSTLINSTEGVLYTEIAALADDGTNRSIAICDGSTSNRVNILYSDITNEIRAIVVVGGSTKFDEEYTITSTLDYHKVALKYKANDFALWIDGVERFTDTSGDIFAQYTLDELSFNIGGDLFPFYGNCKALAVFDEALTDDELELLTGITNYGSFNELAQANGYTII